MKKLGATLVVPIRGDLKHLMRKALKMIKATVTGQVHIPIEVANLAAFFVLSVQVRVSSQGQEQEQVPITD